MCKFVSPNSVVSNPIPPTIQIETDIDYNIWGNAFEFLTYNYKGDAQYYNTQALRELTSGILPVVVYPSNPPFDTVNSWTNCSICLNGKGSQPSDIDPNKPYNGGNTPEGWISLSQVINQGLDKFNYESHGDGSLLPQSNYLQQSITNHPGKTVSLFCGLYHNRVPDTYLTKINVNNDLSFYVLNVQNGD